MNTSELVSVIMPAYNAAPYIAKAIDSIINQTYTNWELLIADDGSRDKTKAIITNYKDPRIKCFHNDENLGYLETCNKLFSLCSGGFITFQDADDWSSPERLARQVATFVQSEDLGICGTWAEYRTLSGDVLREKRTPLTHREILDYSKHHNPFCGASIMIRKNVYDAIGGYRSFFDRIANEDYDWACRIVERFQSINLPEFLYKVHVTEHSITRTIKSPRQLISSDLVHFLIAQREQKGTDSLSDLPLILLQQYERELLAPYYRDQSLMYRVAADIAAYNNDQYKLRLNSRLAVIKNPVKVINWKYLFGSYMRRM